MDGIEPAPGAVAGTAGALTGSYGPGYPDELREDWPALDEHVERAEPPPE